MKRKVSISFLSSKNTARDLSKINLTDADYIHVDAMDGKFVSEKAKPYKILKKLANSLSKRLDVHLMAKNPIKLIHKYAMLDTEFITIHAEIPKKYLEKYLNVIKNYGLKCGIAINPGTDIDILDDYLHMIDLILVMSVEPGKGGQTFIEDTIRKVIMIKKKVIDRDLDILINVDGGINKEVAKKIKFADIIVSGSYVVKSDNFQEAIDTLR